MKPAKYSLSDTDLAGFVVAGYETTMNATGNLLLYLAERPAEQARLRQDPERIPEVIEESLRYDNPTHLFARTVTCDTALSGITMKKGDRLSFWGMVEHDPESCQGALNATRNIQAIPVATRTIHAARALESFIR